GDHGDARLQRAVDGRDERGGRDDGGRDARRTGRDRGVEGRQHGGHGRVGGQRAGPGGHLDAEQGGRVLEAVLGRGEERVVRDVVHERELPLGRGREVARRGGRGPARGGAAGAR